jgi:hypothetical protein
VKRPSRKLVPHRNPAFGKLCRVWERHPYLPPRMLDSSTVTRPDLLELHCQGVARAAWAAGEHGNVKAARSAISRGQHSPATIASIAHSLAEYHRRTWSERRSGEKIEWLYDGDGACRRYGTGQDATRAALNGVSAALSILVEIPLTIARTLPSFCCCCRQQVGGTSPNINAPAWLATWPATWLPASLTSHSTRST